MYDDGLDNNQRRLVGKLANAAVFDITDSIVDTHSAVVVLAITVTLEICGLGFLILANTQVAAALKGFNVWVWISVAVFLSGFFNGFAIYRLVANKWPHRGSGLNTWLVSIGLGSLNILLLFGLTPSVSG